MNDEKERIPKEAVTVQSWHYHGICLEESIKTMKPSVMMPVSWVTQAEHLLNIKSINTVNNPHCTIIIIIIIIIIKLCGLSPRANYTDQATAACWRS
jgi:hypothetical protein